MITVYELNSKRAPVESESFGNYSTLDREQVTAVSYIKATVRVEEAAKHALLLAKIESLQLIKKYIKESSDRQANKAMMPKEQNDVVQSFNVSPHQPRRNANTSIACFVRKWGQPIQLQDTKRPVRKNWFVFL